MGEYKIFASAGGICHQGFEIFFGAIRRCLHPCSASTPGSNHLSKVMQNIKYQSKNLYDPVWVTGVITAKSMGKNLYLVDGAADVDIGYSM